MTSQFFILNFLTDNFSLFWLNLSIFTYWINVIEVVCFIIGGETIKSISQQSGARIELQRNPPPNADPNMKMFTIRGTPQQIDYARQLIEEKIGVSVQVYSVL